MQKVHAETCVAKKIRKEIENLNKKYLKNGLTPHDLRVLPTSHSTAKPPKSNKNILIATSILIITLCAFYKTNTFQQIYNYVLGVRCVVRNNYFVWEATRPISNCDFCRDVFGPIVLSNQTREDFAKFAYTSKPLVIQGAFLHWPAMQKFSWEFFKELYEGVEDSFRSVDEECQFLHFKSDFTSFKDVFAMGKDRVRNLPGEKSWYVGWGNCHPTILEKMRKYYEKPHFLPDDCEIPSKDYIFMGYDDGATMHLDFISRLMWQAQLKGSKTWHLHPPPECEHICNSINFLVKPGDAVLVDTRIWYHGTTITPGEFSLSVQSEYG